MKKWLTTVKPGNLKQVVAKKSDVVEGESVTAVTVGESEGCVYMGHMMEDEEVEDREEDEESVGEEEGEGETDNDSPGTKDYQMCVQLFLVRKTQRLEHLRTVLPRDMSSKNTSFHR
jgi:hypothetical protein